MKVTRLYAGEHGKSHFEVIEYDLHNSPVRRYSVAARRRWVAASQGNGNACD